MKKSTLILIMAMVLFGLSFTGSLNADVVVYNQTRDSLVIGLLWTSIPSFNVAWINSRQWYRLDPYKQMIFRTNRPPIFTECYWLAIKKEGNWQWAIFTMFYTTAIAYIVSLLTYQIGSLFI